MGFQPVVGIAQFEPLEPQRRPAYSGGEWHLLFTALARRGATT